jgi:hypothetical protein
VNSDSAMFAEYWKLRMEAIEPVINNNQIEFYSDCQPDHCRLNVLYAIRGGTSISVQELTWWLEKTYSEFIRCLNDVYGETRQIQVMECAITPGCGLHPGIGEAFYIRFLERSI